MQRDEAYGVRKAEYPRLVYLFGCYLHEDWVEDAVSVREVFAGNLEPDSLWYRRIIKRFTEQESPEVIAETLLEIDRLLKLGLSSDYLAEVLTRVLGANYHFDDPAKCQPWLQQVGGIVAAGKA
jgi:hypothetical protein